MLIYLQRSKRSIMDIFFQKLLFRKMFVLQCECETFCEVCFQNVGQVICIFNYLLLFIFLCFLLYFFNWNRTTLLYLNCSFWYFLTFRNNFCLRFILDLLLEFSFNFCFNLFFRFLLFLRCFLLCLDFSCL